MKTLEELIEIAYTIGACYDSIQEYDEENNTDFDHDVYLCTKELDEPNKTEAKHLISLSMNKGRKSVK